MYGIKQILKILKNTLDASKGRKKNKSILERKGFWNLCSEQQLFSNFRAWDPKKVKLLVSIECLGSKMVAKLGKGVGK